MESSTDKETRNLAQEAETPSFQESKRDNVFHKRNPSLPKRKIPQFLIKFSHGIKLKNKFEPEKGNDSTFKYKNGLKFGFERIQPLSHLLSRNGTMHFFSFGGDTYLSKIKAKKDSDLTMRPISAYINFGLLNLTPMSSFRFYGGIGIGKGMHKYSFDDDDLGLEIKIEEEDVGFLWQIGFDFFPSKNISIGFTVRNLKSEITTATQVRDYYDDEWILTRVTEEVTIKEQAVTISFAF